jgi:hypothetical protein
MSLKKIKDSLDNMCDKISDELSSINCNGIKLSIKQSFTKLIDFIDRCKNQEHHTNNVKNLTEIIVEDIKKEEISDIENQIDSIHEPVVLEPEEVKSIKLEKEEENESKIEKKPSLDIKIDEEIIQDKINKDKSIEDDWDYVENFNKIANADIDELP